MNVREMMAILAQCTPETEVFVNVMQWAQGSSMTGQYETGKEPKKIESVSDLETKVLIDFEG